MSSDTWPTAEPISLMIMAAFDQPSTNVDGTITGWAAIGSVGDEQ